MKTICMLALLAFLALPNISIAGSDADCVTTFYKTKNMACIDALLEVVQSTSQEDQKKSDPMTIIGFLAQVLSDYPEKKEQILVQQASFHSKSVYFAALYRAGLFEDAKKYAEANGWPEGFKKYQDSGTPTLKQLTPVFYPSDNDLMIGAYMASGCLLYTARCV